MADPAIRAVGIRDGKIYVDGGGVLQAEDQVGNEIHITDDDDEVVGIVIPGHAGDGKAILFDVYHPDAAEDADPERSVTGTRRIDADAVKEWLNGASEEPGADPGIEVGATTHEPPEELGPPFDDAVPIPAPAGSTSEPDDGMARDVADYDKAKADGDDDLLSSEEVRAELDAEPDGQTKLSEADDPAFQNDPALMLTAPNGRKVDAIQVKVGGSLGLDRWDRENVALMRALHQGREVTLTVTCDVDGVSFLQKRDSDNVLKELVQAATLKVVEIDVESAEVDGGWGAAVQSAADALKQSAEEMGVTIEVEGQVIATGTPEDLDGETPGIDPADLPDMPD